MKAAAACAARAAMAMVLTITAPSFATAADEPAPRVLARVNGDAIDADQVNAALSQRQSTKPREDIAEARKQVLERLVDMRLAVQEARKLGLDEHPNILALPVAQRQEAIARAYLEHISADVRRPDADAVDHFFTANPALFSQRRIYRLRELNIEVAAQRVPALQAKLKQSKRFDDFVAHLKAQAIPFTDNRAVRAAEQLPLAHLDEFAALKDHQATFSTMAAGAQVIYLEGSESKPVGREHAKPAITLFLYNEAKRGVIEDRLKALRANASIEWF